MRQNNATVKTVPDSVRRRQVGIVTLRWERGCGRPGVTSGGRVAWGEGEGKAKARCSRASQVLETSLK